MKKLNILSLLFIFLLPSFAVNAETPAEILKKPTDKVTSAKGIKGTFTLSGNGNNINGTIYASGNKFHISTGTYSVWYNGKNMWNYNSNAKETTLTVPTASEISETNPLEYLKSYSKEYKAQVSSTKISGKHVIDLVPISRKSAMKNIQIILNSKSLKPEKFVITAKNNSKTTISIKSLDYSSAIKSTIFNYPSARYPKAEIIDLR